MISTHERWLQPFFRCACLCGKLIEAHWCRRPAIWSRCA